MMPAGFWGHPSMVEAFTSRHMGRVIRAWRNHPHHHRRTVSQDQVAGWAGIGQPQLSRIETGPPSKNLDDLIFWVRLLHIPPEWLWFTLPGQPPPALASPDAAAAFPRQLDPTLASPVNSDGNNALLVDSEDNGNVDRRAFVRGAAATLATALTATSGDALARLAAPGATDEDRGWMTMLCDRGSRIADSDIRRLAERTAKLRRLDDVLGGTATVQLYESEVALTRRLITDTYHPTPIHLKLLALHAEQIQQAGWAAFDAGLNDRAAQHFNNSLAAADEAGDPALAANSLALLAYQQAFHRIPDIDTAHTSCHQIDDTSTAGPVLALLHERQAFSHAVAGDIYRTQQALEQARRHLADPSDTQAPDWVFWVDETEIDIMAGRCWAQLHRPLRAVPLLTSALARYDDSHARDKALYLTWLADAYLDANEPEQAAAATHQAVNLAVGVASPRPWTRIEHLAQRLEPHHAIYEVAAVLDQVKTATRQLSRPQPNDQATPDTSRPLELREDR
jgi:tetratricopeptide (TPR) repeat protein